MALKDELIDQFDRQFKTLDGVYSRASQEAWTYTSADLKGVWHWMYHILESIEFYLSEQSVDSFQWGKRFGVGWEEGTVKAIPTMQDMKAYQTELRDIVHSTLAKKTDDEITAENTSHPWAGGTYLGKLIYLIRNTQEHIGNINQVLRLNSCDLLQWY